MASTAKDSIFSRKLCIRSLMKLKSSVEGRSGGGGAGNYSRFMEGVEHFWRTTTAAVLQKYLWSLELACML